MKLRRDGSIQSSLTPTVSNVGRKDDYAIYRCMITRVIYTDTPGNITLNSSNPRVLYDAVVLGGFASGQIISNCRLSTELGGTYTFYERVLKASVKDISGSRLSDGDGDIVFVQFVQGHTGYPVIVGLDNGISPVETGAKTSDGPRSVKQYNGVREEINNFGEYEMRVKGGTADKEKGGFVPASSPLLVVKASKDEKYTRTFKSGLTITEDGKNDLVKVNTAGGVTITVDGKNDEIILETKAGSRLRLKQAKVALGANSIELLDELSKVTQLVSDWARNIEALHTHEGNLGYPTEKPYTYLDSIQLADDLDVEKGKVNSIKGSL